MREIKISGKGERRKRSKATALAKVKHGEEYFIRRNGFWYRPNAAGYTDDVLEAGLYLGCEARSHLNAEGVSLVSLQSMRNEIWRQMQEHLGRAAKLSELALR